MGSMSKEVVKELPSFVQVFKDGSVERLKGSPFVPISPEDPETGVSSKDIPISKNPPISARIFLPKLTEPNLKIPILVYYHGGAFCIESAFSSAHHQFLNYLVSQAKVVAVSVEYRLAPEHPLPIGYEDCWAALQWVSSHLSEDENEAEKEPWLIKYGDFGRVFLGGDSAGANIVHNTAMRVGKEGLPCGLKITGAFLTHPYFCGSKPVGSEPVDEEPEKNMGCIVWNFSYPAAPGGVDNPLMNPLGPEAPSLEGIGCSRLLVSVAENDGLKSRGVWYYEEVKKSDWKGEVELVEVEGEGHAFHIDSFGTDKSKNLIKRLADFLIK